MNEIDSPIIGVAGSKKEPLINMRGQNIQKFKSLQKLLCILKYFLI